MKVRIYFESPHIKEDSVTVEIETLEDIRQLYVDWWVKYGKDVDYAMCKLIRAEILDG